MPKETSRDSVVSEFATLAQLKGLPRVAHLPSCRDRGRRSRMAKEAPAARRVLRVSNTPTLIYGARSSADLGLRRTLRAYSRLEFRPS